MLKAFVVGSIGTVVGTVIASLVLPLNLGPDGWKIAAALASRHIGGAVNYVAVRIIDEVENQPVTAS